MLRDAFSETVRKDVGIIFCEFCELKHLFIWLSGETGYHVFKKFEFVLIKIWNIEIMFTEKKGK